MVRTTTTKTPRRTLPRRRGSTALLAMLFLTLMSVLAVGFYATVSTATQVSYNEQRTSRALLAGDSGMQFMKYQLATLGMPAHTTMDQLFNQVYTRLGTKLNNYPNMPAGASTIDLDGTGTIIRIPAGGNNWIPLDTQGSAFRAEIQKLQSGEKIEVRVYGKYGSDTSDGGTKGIKLQYANFPNPAAIFNYGVASNSPITMNGNVTIQGTPGNEQMGSVLSAHVATNTPLTMTGAPKISGNVSFVNPNAAPSISANATIAGLSPGQPGFNDVIHKGVQAPEFPVIDTSGFAAYVPAAGTTGPSVISAKNPTGTFFKNIRIKAGTNPTFNANTTIQGVIWIEQPNNVKFNGGATVQGVIVTDTDGNNNASASLSANTVNFSGSVTFQGVNTLPATSDFPATLRSLTGSAMLLPGFATTFSGNFNTINGSLISSQMTYSGTAGGTIKGSVINLRDSSLSMGGTADIIVESQGTSNYPAGVLFGSHYSPLPFTYEEISQ